VESAGVITTPGVAFLAGAFGFDAGVVVSASHNPYHDNGIKIFSPSGKKIDEQMERRIEQDIYASNGDSTPEVHIDKAREDGFCTAYLDHLRNEAGSLSAAGLRLVIDCGNGAASYLAPRLFESLGAEVIAINCDPDGRNINENCGSTHIEGMQGAVAEHGANLGIAFDGDADRALFADENGHLVDGDATLWVLARYLRDHGKLRNSTVVATVMSNIGLELALSSRGIKLVRTDVGDKYVLERLLDTGSEIGGEQSGHIIFPEISLVGDGMMTALMLLRAVLEKGRTLSEAAAGFVRYPQVLMNVRVREKLPFETIPDIAAAASVVDKELDGNGRLLLRYSGTENLARVMIEGKEQSSIESQARRLIDVIESSLG
jgi:phosphoglucosamine mutase